MKKTFILLLALLAKSALGQPAENFTVHEWGTFTSVQGGDGLLRPWRPLKTSELPDFVYNWTKPGLNRFANQMFVGKGEMFSLQRMETPVIYFYSKQELNVDVSVAFPKGLITEWYPQATQIGPSSPADTNLSLDFALPESRATWKNLLITPAAHQLAIPQPLLRDGSGSHYYSARETDAALVQTRPTGKTIQAETEKFIFYRGAGSFETPLRVTVDTNNSVTVQNRGAEPLSHLLFVSIHDGKGAFAVLDELSASNSTSWLDLDSLSSENWKHYPLAQFQNEVGAQMESALVSENLFADEARAMVNTWKDSWFTEEGDRVLYILPRPWTDDTLPLTLMPRPEKLVRVMVGRAEIITPQALTRLDDALTKVEKGNVDVRNQAIAQLKRFGRFAEPALRLLATNPKNSDRVNLAYQLLSKPAPTVGKLE